MIIQTVLLSGKQGSGKTTLANALIKEYTKFKGWHAHHLTFAGPLYEMHNFIWGYLDSRGIKNPHKKDGYLLQMLGTEWGRNRVSEDLWVDLLKAEIKLKASRAYASTHRLLFVVSDCRFPNELIPSAFHIRLECPEELRKTRAEMWRETTAHLSETALDNYEGWHLKLKTNLLPVEGCVSLIMAKLLAGDLDTKTAPETTTESTTAV